MVFAVKLGGETVRNGLFVGGDSVKRIFHAIALRLDRARQALWCRSGIEFRFLRDFGRIPFGLNPSPVRPTGRSQGQSKSPTLLRVDVLCLLRKSLAPPSHRLSKLRWV